MSSGIEQESELAAARRINQYLTMSLNSRRKNRLCEKNRELTGAARLRGIVGRPAIACTTFTLKSCGLGLHVDFQKIRLINWSST